MKQVVKEHTFLDELFRSEIVLIDLGAARGEFTLEISKRYPISKGVLVEPNPNNVPWIPAIPNRVVYPNLIGNNSGEICTFYEDSKALYDGSKVFSKDDSIKHQIETITLRDIVERNQIDYIDLLKVDIEGSEYELLLVGNHYVLQMCRQITVEFHDFVDPSLKPKTEVIIERMRRLGFEMLATPGHWGVGTDHYDVLFYKL